MSTAKIIISNVILYNIQGSLQNLMLDNMKK